jgi:hypothetical protein
MVATKVKIETIGRPLQGPLVLTLKQFDDGWTYEVEDLGSGPLPLPWRAGTMGEAEEKLKDSYDDTVWTITVVKEDPEPADHPTPDHS